MRNFNINIAGYNIRFETGADGPELKPSVRFLRNICNETGTDIIIRVRSGAYDLPSEAKNVFHAPYVEEINGIMIKNKEEFWNIYKHHNDLFIQTIFPLSSEKKKSTLKFSLNVREWDLWFEEAGQTVDPLEYPLDGLILYYLTVIHGDILIHASGVRHAGRGYLFSGISGKGKTTLARIWDESGGKVIHDDRLIIRNIDGIYKIFNTPVYNNDEPRESSLNRIFIIEHSTINSIVPVKGASAVSLVMVNCIQHNWEPLIIARLMGSVSIMCNRVSVSKLFFKPDRSIIDYILDNE
jgi:hypothetical protein